MECIPPHEHVVKLLGHNVLPVADNYVAYKLEIERADYGDVVNHAIAGTLKIGNRRLLKQMVSAVKHLHDHDIAHLDIKPDNIFLKTPTHAVLGDFGGSRKLLGGLGTKHLTDSHTSMSSPGYCPPEVYSGDYFCDRSDVFSLGATMYALRTRRFPPEGDKVQRAMQVCFQTSMDCELCEDRDADVLVAMVDPNAMKRPSIDEVWAHLNTP